MNEQVSLIVPDGREHLVVDGVGELIEDDPLRAVLHLTPQSVRFPE